MIEQEIDTKQVLEHKKDKTSEKRNEYRIANRHGDKMDILLSVIVPMYNVERYIKKCIESICSQTYRNLEIILVDDGSTDDSLKIAEKIAKSDSRIKIIKKINGGQVSARKAGIQAATGMYITSVDADDWIEKDRFMNLLSKGLSSRPDMVHMEGYFKEYDQETCLMFRNNASQTYHKMQIMTELMKLFAGDNVFLDRKMEFGHWQWCVKREIYVDNILKIDERIRRIEDFVTIFACILDCEVIECIEESGYHYVQRQGSINRRNVNWNENHADIYYAQIKKILQSHEITEEILNAAKQYVYHNIFLTNYKKLYKYYTDFLFPFPLVKKNSTIVIYGAGNIGVEMVNAIDDNPCYEIVAWVDAKETYNARSNHLVENISVIKERSYDYIVIAILVADISREVKKQLISEGIAEEKIVLMNTSCMSMQDLEYILG